MSISLSIRATSRAVEPNKARRVTPKRWASVGLHFVRSGLNYDATVRNLELLGEAATRFPDGIRQSNPQIPWRLVIAPRNRLIHGYLGIDNDRLWSIIRSDIPAMLPQLIARRGKLP